MKTIQERREFVRAPIQVLLHEEDVDGKRLAEAVNISELGMRYRMPAFSSRKSKGEELLLEFCLPNDRKPIKALGFVTSHKNDRVAQNTSVTFMFLKDEDSERIRKFVSGVSKF
jgi:hypothetical protein